MNIAIIYLLLLFFFLIIISYLISTELLNIFREKHLIKNILNYKVNKYIKHMIAAKLYLSKKILDSAIYELKFCIKFKILTNIHLIDIYNLFGISYFTMKNYNKAIKYYKKALNLSTGDITILNNCAEAFIRENRIEEAKDIYIDFLIKNPENVIIEKKLNNLHKLSKNIHK